MIKKLVYEELEQLYENQLVKDFPKEECKPLELLKLLYDSGKNCTYAWYEKEQLLAYAILEKADNQNVWLLDYLAVPNSCRGKGYGGRMLQYIKDSFFDADAVFIEIERIEQAQDEKEYTERVLRKKFYLKNGVIETDVFTRADGNIDYEILCLPIQKMLKENDARGAMQAIYETFFDEGMYEIYE